MRMLHRQLACILLAASVALFLPRDARASGPDHFVAALGERVIAIVTEHRDDAAALEGGIRDLFIAAFAVDDMAKFVLGRAWRNATEPQRSAFKQAFQDYAIRTYAAQLGQYSGERFLVKGVRPVAEEGEQAVASVIERPAGGPPLRLDWRVRSLDGGWRVTDIYIEGVSMALTHRQEYAAVLQQAKGDIAVLIEKMRSRAGKG